ncbi:MAG: ribonuclease R [Nitrospinae bacterium]|nr:ribonuclease R [Nitrospinota bacterium]
MKRTYHPQKIFDQLKNILKHPASTPTILSALDVPKKDKSSVKKILKTLANQGRIIKLRKGVYGLTENMEQIEGTLQGNERGFGFVLVKGGEDVFIPKSRMNGAMHGDNVLCRVDEIDREGRREGTIIDIVTRNKTNILGAFQFNGEFGFVVPYEKSYAYDIFIKKKDFNGAKPGDFVEAEIITFPSKDFNPRGRVIKVIKNPEAYLSSLDFVLNKHGIQKEFPGSVIKEVKGCPDTVEESALKGRISLENKIIFTIDGEDAKDFDDAVSIEEMNDGRIELGVHIADVSHYVIKGSQTDIEASKRGNSFYFPDTVIPMLPFNLSNGICSLKPDERRLTLSCFMTINQEGEIEKYHFKKTSIKSCKRFTYTEVFALLQGEKKEPDDKLVKTLTAMNKLAYKLREKRFEAGSIDFDIPEPKITLKKEKVVSIKASERNDAHQLIEDFMLVANICAAKYLEEKIDCSVFRIHEEPAPEKIKGMLDIIKVFNLVPFHEKTEINGKFFQQILEAFKGHDEEAMVNKIVLRSMQKAEYSTKNIGHFGLGFTDYTHFTSPIRRYADLIVHRLIKETMDKEGLKYQDSELVDITAHISNQERTAISADRDFNEMKIIEYLDQHQLEIFEGIISGITSYGFYVELTGYFIDGLVRMTALHDDFYNHDKERYRLIGERTARVFKMGAKVRVKIAKLDKLKQEIDLELA